MSFGSLKRLPVRAMGRVAPDALRFLAHHNRIGRGRWPMLEVLISDPKCRNWLASLENPTRTRHKFTIFTMPGDLTSDWIKLHGQHEVGIEAFILSHLRPGAAFLDVGANIGYFSLLAAVVGKSPVFAFEPQASVAELLERSVEHNGIGDRVRVVRGALSDSSSTMRMTACPGNSGHSRIVTPGAADAQTYNVPVVAFDDWYRENPIGPVCACKIDTEGADYRVLRGMGELLERDRPAVVVEVIDEHLREYASAAADLLELMRKAGYTEVTRRYWVLGDQNRYFERPR
ncbi:MAG TPA: FkbM family methyltransferase [Opitutaceae bacterium]|jgi:FkbM family methyltransferase